MGMGVSVHCAGVTGLVLFGGGGGEGWHSV